MKRAALHNLRCKVNAYETEAMEELLKKDGFTIVGFDEMADVYVINTCSVTNIADRKSRQMIHKCKKLNPDACVVAVGCYVQNFGKDVADELGGLTVGKLDLQVLLHGGQRHAHRNSIFILVFHITALFLRL